MTNEEMIDELLGFCDEIKTAHAEGEDGEDHASKMMGYLGDSAYSYLPLLLRREAPGPTDEATEAQLQKLCTLISGAQNDASYLPAGIDRRMYVAKQVWKRVVFLSSIKP